MPSTFTNNGGIELPADGEKDGVWGDVVNLNMQIVDRLTNGVGAVSLTGTTHTLTTANGVLSDGQYALVVFGGAPTGTNTVTISPNDAEKVFFIRNTTSQSVVMTQGSGGNVTIPAGAGAIVYANGAGTGAAVADLTATFVFSLTQAGITATPAELNILDGATLSTAELNYVDGVTSAIQTQIDSKQATITGAATTIASDDLAVDRALVSDGSGKVAASAVTTDELAVLDGVTASTAELNLLDGATLVVSDVTATAAEINALEGLSGGPVGVSEAQTLTNKTLTAPAIVNPTVTGTPVEDSYSISGTSVALEPDNGSIQFHQLTGETTYTDAFTSGQQIRLLVFTDGNTINWPASIFWLTAGNVAPDPSTNWMALTLWKIDTVLWAAVEGDTANGQEKIGVGQTWQNMEGSRASSTWYQNTTGKPIMVFVKQINGGDIMRIGVSTVDYVTINNKDFDSDLDNGLTIIIPVDGFYYLETAKSVWKELR